LLISFLNRGTILLKATCVVHVCHCALKPFLGFILTDMMQVCDDSQEIIRKAIVISTYNSVEHALASP